MMKIKDKTVTIMGFAASGMAAADLALDNGARVQISEQRQDKLTQSRFGAWKNKKDVAVEWGKHSLDFIENSDIIVLSPGVPNDLPVIQKAQERGIPVMGEIEFAYRFCPSKIIAVTGSNGKTTVSTLISKLLSEAGRKIIFCGNIGTPFSSVIPYCTKQTLVVLEISSFQLESIRTFTAHVAVFLNFSQNHLDRHKDCEEYFEAKKRIFENQSRNDFAVLNIRDEKIKTLGQNLQSRIIYFNTSKDQNLFDDPNQRAAYAVVRIFGVSKDKAKKVFDEFCGVEHRMEKVRTLCGVHFINDSKSTTVEATRWALERTAGPVILICGGRDKNLDYSVIKDLIAKKVRQMITIGEARERIGRIYREMIPFEEADSLRGAVDLARSYAKDGDHILLSPMCASFDMFKNFEERGKAFKEIVHSLNEDSSCAI